MGIAFRFDNHPRVTKQGIMSATNLARLAPVEPMQPIYAMEILAQTERLLPRASSHLSLPRGEWSLESLCSTVRLSSTT